MAKNKNNSANRKQTTKITREVKSATPFRPLTFMDGLSDEIRHSIIAILFFVLGIALSFASFGKAGFAGGAIYGGLNYLLGVGYFVLPTLFFILGISLFRSTRPSLAATSTTGAFLFLFSSLGLINIFSGNDTGGIFGWMISSPLVALFDTYLAATLLFALLVISLIVMFNARPNLSSLFFWRARENGDDKEDAGVRNEGPTLNTDADAERPYLELGENAKQKEEEKKPILAAAMAKVREKKTESIGEGMPLRELSGTDYTPPPLSILEADRGKPGVGDIKANANIIKRTLAQYGITVEMDEVSIGPSVTRYALKPAEGVKLSRIVGLQNELSYALAAHPIRIEAPIPGQSLVGIEVPNSTKTVVGLKTLFASDEYQNSIKPLLLALGRGVSGKLYYADLAKMPHVLIAGATGAGKSVTIHAIINSLLYRNAPENLRLIMIDPKRVELTLYNKIPHLLTPVITDAKKAILALKWAAKEMDRRYNILEAESVRDISSYHKNVLGPAVKTKNEKRKTEREEVTDATMPERMPYIVIVLDELADIMQAYPRELESAIVRLAQMSRAVGIHLILSTQRPSVNVITGLIKANVPARVALQVASQIDSRTILDASGAEKLLGAGDMLYISGEMSKPTRIQSAFMSEGEVKSVVKYLAGLETDKLPDEINFSQGSISNDRDPLFESSFEDADGDGDDDLYEDARIIVIEAGKASTSYLQRRLKVGYARAARLMDMLEERNVISAGNGAKPRQVIEQPRAVQ